MSNQAVIDRTIQLLNIDPHFQGYAKFVLSEMAKGEGMQDSYNNPLATTRATDSNGTYIAGGTFNSVGVRTFSSVEAGAQATAATIRQQNFRNLLTGLRTGPNLDFWTTGPGASSLRLWQGGSSEDINLLRQDWSKLGAFLGGSSAGTQPSTGGASTPATLASFDPFGQFGSNFGLGVPGGVSVPGIGTPGGWIADRMWFLGFALGGATLILVGIFLLRGKNPITVVAHAAETVAAPETEATKVERTKKAGEAMQVG